MYVWVGTSYGFGMTGRGGEIFSIFYTVKLITERVEIQSPIITTQIWPQNDIASARWN